MKTERQLLVDKLNEIKTSCGDEGSFYPACMGCVADFILAEKKRIVEPLIRHKNLWCGNWSEYTAGQAIDEVLRLAGVNTGEGT